VKHAFARTRSPAAQNKNDDRRRRSFSIKKKTHQIAVSRPVARRRWCARRRA